MRACIALPWCLRSKINDDHHLKSEPQNELTQQIQRACFLNDVNGKSLVLLCRCSLELKCIQLTTGFVNVVLTVSHARWHDTPHCWTPKRFITKRRSNILSSLLVKRFVSWGCVTLQCFITVVCICFNTCYMDFLFCIFVLVFIDYHTIMVWS